jgi:hypothetical protein
MARRKAGPLVAVGAVAVLGLLGYSTYAESGGSQAKVADPGGGVVPASPGPPAPYAISTLAPVGTAGQDPGGGGGGTGEPGTVGPPGIQGAQGSGSAQGFQGGGDILYLSGVNLLDPNRAATTSGTNTFPTLTGGLGGVLGPITGGTSATGCATTPQEVDYYAIPLTVESVGFNGAPFVHLRISGSGPVTATLYEESPDGNCVRRTSGSGAISGGIANFSMGGLSLEFSKGFTPVVVFSAPQGQHTITTDSANPSYVRFPQLHGV